MIDRISERAMPALRRRLAVARALAAGTVTSVAPVASTPNAEPPSTVEEVLARDGRDNANMRRLVSFSLAADACCVDVGAHRGGLLQEIVRVAPDGRHVAYEPLPHLAEHLRQHFPQVEIHEAALSNHSGSTSFAHVRGVAEGCSGFQVVTAPPGYGTDVEALEVRLERLDDTLADFERIALIKVDVEGAEQQVFEGGIETLIRTRPIVVFEHTYGASNVYGTEPGRIYELLCGEAGLRIFDLDGNGPFSEAEFELRARRGDPINFLAHA